MKTGSRRAIVLLACAAMIGAALAAQPAGGSKATPFKLGTFSADGREFLGLVLRDTVVIDIDAANAQYERSHANAQKVQFPSAMTELIARYDTELGPRLRTLASENEATQRAAYIRQVSAVKVLPPVRPAVILNAGANYPAHAQGIIQQGARTAAPAGPANPAAPLAGRGPPRAVGESMPGIWERAADDTRADNPYLFLKSPSVVVGANDDVVIPRGRTQIDWECEFAVVVGRKAQDVPVAAAQDYIFGYSIEFDVSDRGGRGDRKMGGGPDWFVQKNHDTFGPIGPYIVPKEFVPDPRNVRHYFTLNGEIKQDSNTSRMEYNQWEMLSFGSSIMTLHPGDIISLGSPSGTNIERDNPRWMQPGDVGVCVVEGIGEQRHNIVAQQ
jgi:2-keto-4-pentenoate hydratase/2-oxohepta-3-ene-1,7-dioic acid hydratase in catechol pathway